MYSLSFGNYNFDVTNNIELTPGLRELHGAERTITVLKTLGRGTRVLDAVFEGKVMEVPGIIKCDDANDLVAAVQDFIAAMAQPAQPLVINNFSGQFVYDGAYASDTPEIIEAKDTYGQSYATFRVVFMLPDGFVRSTTQTTQTATGITSFPYESSITIDGNTNPDPVISITFVDASTLTAIYFTNLTTNQQISVSGVTFVDGDTLTFNIRSGQVLHNATPIVFDGVFPDFIPGVNNYQLTGSGDSNLQIDQTMYDAEQNVYGNFQIGQKFTASGSYSGSQLAVLLKKVFGTVTSLVSYDDFEDNSIDTGKWNTSGTVTETGGRLRVYRIQGGAYKNSSADTSGKTAINPFGQPIKGFQINVTQGARGTEGGNNYARYRITNGTDFIAIDHSMGLDSLSLSASSYYGGSGIGFEIARWGGNTGVLEVKPNNGNIEIWQGGTLRYTFTGVSPASGSYLIAEARADAGSTALDSYIEMEYVLFYEDTAQTANGTLHLEIQTNSAGSPSGTPVASATITVGVDDIPTTFGALIKAFASSPAFVNTTVYHFVAYQDSGDVNNYYVFKINSADVISGNLETSSDGGATWSQETGKDMYLQLWSTLPTAFDLTLQIQYFKSQYNAG